VLGQSRVSDGARKARACSTEAIPRAARTCAVTCDTPSPVASEATTAVSGRNGVHSLLSQLVMWPILLVEADTHPRVGLD